MNEFIEVRLRSNGKRLRIARQVPGGIEFEEPDPLERTVGIGFRHRNEATRLRMDSVRRTQGWLPHEFRLAAAVEDGAIVLRGVTPQALPAGFYRLRLQIEEVTRAGGWQNVRVEQDRHGVVEFDLTMDDRGVAVDLTGCDPRIQEVLDRSTLDDVDAVSWATGSSVRPARQACLLNLLASLRVRPKLADPLIDLVDHVFHAANDRIYARVDRRLHETMKALVLHPTQPFYDEGRPHAPIHGRLLTEMPEPPDVKARFDGLHSFRGEGKPSMQVVVAVPPVDLPYTYAEFDLDLGNPLQDLIGFFVHVGELLDGKSTNHLDLRKHLAKTKAGEFLYYTVSGL